MDYEIILTHTATIRAALQQFLADRAYPEIITDIDGSAVSLDGKEDFYTDSPWYQYYSTDFHIDPHVARFIADLVSIADPKTSFIDVGCASGITGLTVALCLPEQLVTFHDFTGIGADFIIDFSARQRLNTQFVPYGKPITRHSLALAFDVIEHTGSHVGTLTWLRLLGDNVALTYPLLPFRPPWQREADEYIDDDALQTIIAQRYKIIHTATENQRRFTLYT